MEYNHEYHFLQKLDQAGISRNGFMYGDYPARRMESTLSGYWDDIYPEACRAWPSSMYNTDKEICNAIKHIPNYQVWMEYAKQTKSKNRR